MSRDELLDVLHEQVSELSDAQLERLVKAMKHTCFWSFVNVMAPEPHERRPSVPAKFVVDAPGWKGCNGFEL
jgi:hypothetical protein